MAGSFGVVVSELKVKKQRSWTVFTACEAVLDCLTIKPLPEINCSLPDGVLGVIWVTQSTDVRNGVLE